MKSTKNVFLTGIALATALFASVQVAAMEPERKPYYEINPENTELAETRRVNPNLQGWDRLPFWRAINNNTNTMREIKDPNNPKFVANAADRTRRNAALQEAIDMAKKVYYGDRAFNEYQLRYIQETMNNIVSDSIYKK